METHAHADHLTLSLGQHRPKIAIGKRINQVQATFAGKYGVAKEELYTVFDKLWDDNEKFEIGG